MIIYNVTINVEEGIHHDWLHWLQSVHIPEVMATGCFVSHKVMRLITTQEGEEGITYAVQYTATDMKQYMTYQKQYAPELRQKGEQLFGNRFVAFRTLLEEV